MIDADCAAHVRSHLRVALVFANDRVDLGPAEVRVDWKRAAGRAGNLHKTRR